MRFSRPACFGGPPPLLRVLSRPRRPRKRLPWRKDCPVLTDGKSGRYCKQRPEIVFISTHPSHGDGGSWIKASSEQHAGRIEKGLPRHAQHAIRVADFAPSVAHGAHVDDVTRGLLQNFRNCPMFRAERQFKLLTVSKPACRATDRGLRFFGDVMRHPLCVLEARKCCEPPASI